MLADSCFGLCILPVNKNVKLCRNSIILLPPITQMYKDFLSLNVQTYDDLMYICTLTGQKKPTATWEK